MKAYERVIAQELPPENSSVLWLNNSMEPAVLCHHNNGRWRPLLQIDLSSVAKQGDNPLATLSEVLRLINDVVAKESTVEAAKQEILAAIQSFEIGEVTTQFIDTLFEE